MSTGNNYITSEIVFGDQFADVRFVFNGKPQTKISAHATVLRIECPTLFDKCIRDKQNFGEYSVALTNWNSEAFCIFLELLYGGYNNRALKHVRDIFDLCKKFNVPQIVNKLLKHFDEFSSDTVFDVIQACLDLNNDSNLAKALQFVTDNFSSMLVSDKFLQATVNTVCEILKINCVADFQGEREIIDAVARYIIANSDHKNDHPPFSAIIKLIRFPTLSPLDFGRVLDDYPNLLTTAEAVEIFKELNGVRENNLGFSNINRLDDTQFLNKEPETNYSQIFIDKEISKTVTGLFPVDVTTTFTVNKSIVITEIWLCNAIEREIKIKGCLRKHFGSMLTFFDGKTTVNSERFSTSFLLDRFVVLKPGQKYTIDITYICKDVLAYNTNADPSCHKTAESDGIKLLFEKLNPMIRSVVVKPLPSSINTGKTPDENGLLYLYNQLSGSKKTNIEYKNNGLPTVNLMNTHTEISTKFLIEEPVGEQLQIFVDKERSKTLVGIIPKTPTTMFTVNKPIVMTRIWLCNATHKIIDFMATLRKENGDDLATVAGQTTVNSGNFSSGHSLNRLVVLEPNNIYHIDINYQYEELLEYNSNSGPTCPCVVVKDDVELNFTRLHPMIRSIVIKSYDDPEIVVLSEKPANYRSGYVQIFADKDRSISMKGVIPKSPKTVFTVNRPITMIQVWLCNAQEKTINVSCELTTAGGKHLASFSGNTVVNSSNFSAQFLFNRLVRLVPNKKYCIDIKYLCNDTVKYNTSSDPNGSKLISKDGIEINLEQLNPMIRSVVVKKID